MNFQCNNVAANYISATGSTADQWTTTDSCFDNTQLVDKTLTTRWEDTNGQFATPTYNTGAGSKFCDGADAVKDRAVTTGIAAGDPGSLNKVYDYSNPGDTLVLPAGKFEVESGASGNMGL